LSLSKSDKKSRLLPLAAILDRSRYHFELVAVLEPFAEATTVCQGDEVATIGVIVPSVISLYKHLQGYVKSAKHTASLVRTLLESLCRRFKGLLQLVKVLEVPKDDEIDTATFGKVIYLVAAVLDPDYGFVWLEDDHPGSQDIKDGIRIMITDAIIQQANRVDAKSRRLSNDADTNMEESTGMGTPAVSAQTVPSSSTIDSEPLAKKVKKRSVLFASYERRRDEDASTSKSVHSVAATTSAAVLLYLSNLTSNCKAPDPWTIFETNPDLRPLSSLYEKVFCCPASSAPVERVFSHSGLFIRPHRARMGKKLLCNLFFSEM